jgi:hypothetical protein
MKHENNKAKPFGWFVESLAFQLVTNHTANFDLRTWSVGNTVVRLKGWCMHITIGFRT